jgi:hypothetical protein
MRFILAVIVLLLSSVTISAAPNEDLPPGLVKSTKTIICGDLMAIVKFLDDKFKETIKMRIASPNGEGETLIFHSPQNTITILETNGKLACFLSSGDIVVDKGREL